MLIQYTIPISIEPINDNKQIESPFVYHVNLRKNWVFSLPHPEQKINGLSYDNSYGIETCRVA